MKRTLLIVLALAASSGCERTEEKSSAPPSASAPMQQNDAPKAAAVAADDTGKNERDRNSDTVTPIDQGENAVDLSITQQIRQGVVKSDGMSSAARNVKIITADGVVTLRGPVETAEEKSAIASIAKQVSGAKRVDNQLEIAAK